MGRPDSGRAETASVKSLCESTVSWAVGENEKHSVTGRWRILKPLRPSGHPSSSWKAQIDNCLGMATPIMSLDNKVCVCVCRACVHVPCHASIAPPHACALCLTGDQLTVRNGFSPSSSVPPLLCVVRLLCCLLTAVPRCILKPVL